MLYEDNVRLSQIEYVLQHLHLRSWPRCLGLVLSNRCNIGCIHCYQSKNGDNLLHPVEIGQDLRREFAAFYPYLSTLRLQGGELFAIPGFRELLDDVAAAVNRPIVSISTNGTLIDEEWAERIVRIPLQTVTISIDGATPATYAKLRRGGKLETVLANIERIRRWKKELNSPYPHLDSFFVVMRSNFREIPEYLELMRSLEITTVSLQTMEVNRENTSRVLTLVEDEVICSRAEVTELHSLLRETVQRQRPHFRTIRLSGLTDLFQTHHLDVAFINEGADGLYPDSDDLAGTVELCPNPWTTLFVIENGDVHLCFLAQPIGNLYQTPLASIWNSPQAVAKRSHMAAGRYLASGCSSQWCSWREGTKATSPAGNEAKELIHEIQVLRDRAVDLQPAPRSSPIAPVRRLLDSRDRRIAELETMFQHLCQINGDAHQQGQDYIKWLEGELRASTEGTLMQAAREVSKVWWKVRQRMPNSRSTGSE